MLYNYIGAEVSGAEYSRRLNANAFSCIHGNPVVNRIYWVLLAAVLEFIKKRRDEMLKNAKKKKRIENMINIINYNRLCIIHFSR